MYKDETDIDLSAEVIGQFITAFQTIEWALVELMCDLINSGDIEVNVAIATQVTFRNRMKLLRALTKIRVSTEDNLSTFYSVFSEIEKLNDIRNNLVHSHYEFTLSDNGHEIIRKINTKIKMKKGLSIQIEEFKSKEFYKYVQQLIDLRFKIYELRALLN